MSTTQTTSSSTSKKSSFLSLFTNLMNTQNNPTFRSNSRTDSPDIPDLDSARSTITSAYYTNGHFKKSNLLNFNGQVDPIAKKSNSKIIRVAKCFDMDTDAIVYLRETCDGEFMIDASISLIASKPIISSQYYLSPDYLYDIRTLVENQFLFEITNSSTNLQFELLMKRSTKMNRLPFINICLTASDQAVVSNQLTIIVYDVNKNKFIEYFLNDLLQLTKFYKFTKSINNHDLLNKYKAKLDWCMQTIHEFKFDVKLKLNYLQNNPKFGYYLEQYLFRTYSRRNFRRRTANSSSLPLKTINAQNIELKQNNEDSDEMDRESNIERTEKKDTKLKRIIKFATSGHNKHQQKQSIQEDVETKHNSPLNHESKSNYSTVRNKLASIFQFAPESSNKSPTIARSKEANKQFVSVININQSSSSVNVEEYYKRKKVFKRPGLFNSFSKQSSYATSTTNGDFNSDDSRPEYYTSHVSVNNYDEPKRSSSRAGDDGVKGTPQTKRSIQNFLNIRKKTPLRNMSPTPSENYLKTNKSFEVTAI